MSHYQQYQQSHAYAKSLAPSTQRFEQLSANNKMRAAQARSNSAYHWAESGRKINAEHQATQKKWEKQAIEAAAWQTAQRNANKWRGGKTRKGKKSKRSKRSRRTRRK